MENRQVASVILATLERMQRSAKLPAFVVFGLLLCGLIED